MLLEYLIQELIGAIDLIHGSCAGDNNLPCAEDTHRNAFTIPVPISLALSLTESFAGTDTRLIIVIVVEELGIHALIDGLLQHREEIVALQEEFVEIVLLNIVTERIVRINERDIDICDGRLACERALGQRLNKGQEPLDRLHRKGLVGHSRHLDAPDGEQLHIELLPAATERLSNDNSRLL